MSTSTAEKTTAEPVATESLARKAHETIDRVAASSAEAETRVRQQAETAADKARETKARASEAAEASVDQVRGYVRNNPALSAAFAFAAGIVISSLLRR